MCFLCGCEGCVGWLVGHWGLERACGIMWELCIVRRRRVVGRQLSCLSWHKASWTGEHLWGLRVGGMRWRRGFKLESENPESRLAPAVTARSRKSEYKSRLGAGWAGRAADIGARGT